MNTSTEICPSLEDLAAFLDGRLSGDERARVVTHLADCPSCYEVFAEAARYQLEEEEEEEEEADLLEAVGVSREQVPAGAPATVVPFPRRRVIRWIPSIAAMLAVSLAAIPLYQQYYKMPEMRSAELVNPAVAGIATQDTFWDEFIKRGEGDGASLASVPHDVLLGAHDLDLHLSLGRNDRESALDDLTSINKHISAIGLLPDQAKAYVEIQRQIADGAPLGNFLRKAEQIGASLTVEEDPYLAFGKWLEAGRLAALAESPDFFQVPENQKFPRAFLHHEVNNLDPEVARTLGDIKETLDRTAPSSLPYQDLRKQFESILTHYEEESLKSDLD
jgi:hypothetical protein